MQVPDWRSLFPEVSEEQWGDWRWQMRHSIRSVEQVARLVPLTEDERRGCEETREMFRLGISPYYLSLID
ncbi:MAG: KamA family radical SAM protein, partial [Myxococcaceae bacterium]